LWSKPDGDTDACRSEQETYHAKYREDEAHVLLYLLVPAYKGFYDLTSSFRKLRSNPVFNPLQLVRLVGPLGRSCAR